MSNKGNNENEHSCIIVSTPEVLWHGGGNENGKPDPVYSVDYHTLDGNILCTSGIDASIPPKGSVRVSFLIEKIYLVSNLIIYC